MSTVAFIGLGAMGSRMAMNLHAAGHQLRVYNRDRAKTKPFADKGVEPSATRRPRRRRVRSSSCRSSPMTRQRVP